MFHLKIDIVKTFRDGDKIIKTDTTNLYVRDRKDLPKAICNAHIKAASIDEDFDIGSKCVNEKALCEELKYIHELSKEYQPVCSFNPEGDDDTVMTFFIKENRSIFQQI